MFESVAVIGAGTMGRGITQFFLQENVNVSLIDNNENVVEEAVASIKKGIDLLSKKGLSSIGMDECMEKLQIYYSFQKEISADLVIEAIPEKLALKQNVFSEIESKSKKSTIFATNTSGLSISEIALSLNNPDRLIGTHFFTPAAIVPLVEVIKGENTSDIVANFVISGLERMGKKPVMLQKEIPGFIGNRIQHAIAREAISILESGVASAEDIDTVVKWSVGLRMALTGPIEQRDINGLDVHYNIASYLYGSLNNSSTPSPLLEEKVEMGEIGLKTKKGFYDWKEDNLYRSEKRNEKLLELVQFLSQS